MQETRVRSLIWEDPTFCRGMKLVYHNYWAHMPQLLKPVRPRVSALKQEKLPQWEARTLQLEKAQAAMKIQHSQK